MPATSTASLPYSPGLEGIVAGETGVSTVEDGLRYRGYAVGDLCEKCSFDEVAYLLLYGHLPKRSELESYQHKLASLRGLPAPLKTVLEQLPASTHPMDVLRTGCSALGCLEWDRLTSLGTGQGSSWEVPGSRCVY